MVFNDFDFIFLSVYCESIKLFFLKKKKIKSLSQNKPKKTKCHSFDLGITRIDLFIVYIFILIWTDF